MEAELESSRSFDPDFESLLDYFSIGVECRRLLLSKFGVRDCASLERHRASLEKHLSCLYSDVFAPPKAEFAGTVELLLCLLEYMVVLGVTSSASRSRILKGITKSCDFFCWFSTTGGSVASCRNGSANGIKDAMDARPQKLPRQIDSDDDILSPDELETLLRKIQGSSWTYDRESSQFLLPFKGEKIGLPAGFFKSCVITSVMGLSGWWT